MITVEPRPGVDIPTPLADFTDRRPVSMPHDQEIHVGLITEMLLGPLLLGRGSLIESLLTSSGIGELSTHPIDQPHTQVRWQGAEYRTCQGMTGDSVQHPRGPAYFRDAVTMQGFDPPGVNLKLERVTRKPNVALTVPERIAPSIVIPADHDDRNLVAQRGERAGNDKSATRNCTAVGKPEVEEVADDQQTVAEGGGRLEELEQRTLTASGRRPEMGVADDNQPVAKHGCSIGTGFAVSQATRRSPFQLEGSRGG